MNKSELTKYDGQPINYHLAENIGAGILKVGIDSVTITASNSQEGIVGVEPIKLTEEQWSKVAIVDDALYLSV